MTGIAQLLNETLANGALERRLRLVHAKWGSAWEFDELKQTVLAHVLECRNQFRGATPDEFLAWVWQLGKSVAIEQIRRKKREVRFLGRLINRIDQLDLGAAGKSDNEDLVKCVLATLTDDERKLLELRYFRNMSAKEIAKVLGRTCAAVNQLHYRALTKLRKQLKDPGN
jgi:RNA polymerase sigma factor (sigma-70 family)